MHIVYDGFDRSFDFVFNYEFDDESIDFDYEYELLKTLYDKREIILKSLKKFIDEIFIPFISDKIPMTISDIETRPSSYNGAGFLYTKDERYIGQYYDEVTPEYLEKTIKEKNLDKGYRKKINFAEIEEWLENNMNNQLLLPSFKDFFESRNWSKVLWKLNK